MSSSAVASSARATAARCGQQTIFTSTEMTVGRLLKTTRARAETKFDRHRCQITDSKFTSSCAYCRIKLDV